MWHVTLIDCLSLNEPDGFKANLGNLLAVSLTHSDRGITKPTSYSIRSTSVRSYFFGFLVRGLREEGICLVTWQEV